VLRHTHGRELRNGCTGRTGRSRFDTEGRGNAGSCLSCLVSLFPTEKVIRKTPAFNLVSRWAELANAEPDLPNMEEAWVRSQKNTKRYIHQ
jgi:hypothetical protein